MKSFTPQGGSDQPLGKREINCRAALINDPSTQSVCQPAGVIWPYFPSGGIYSLSLSTLAA